MAIWQIDDDYYVDLDQSMVCWKQDAQWHQKSLTPLRQKAVQVVIGDGEADQLVRWKEIISGVYGYEDSLDGRRNFNDLKNILENEYKFTYLESDRGNGYRLRAPKLRRVAKIPSVPPKKPEGDSVPQEEPTSSVPIEKLTPQILCDLLYGSADQRRALLGCAPVPKLRAYPVRDFLAAYLPDLQQLEWNQLDPQARKAVMQGDIRWGRRVLKRQILNNGHFTTEELVRTCRRQLQVDVELGGLGQELTQLLHAAVHSDAAYAAAERAFFLCDVNTYPERGLAILLLAALMGPGAFADLYSGQSAVSHFAI